MRVFVRKIEFSTGHFSKLHSISYIVICSLIDRQLWTFWAEIFPCTLEKFTWVWSFFLGGIKIKFHARLLTNERKYWIMILNSECFIRANHWNITSDHWSGFFPPHKKPIKSNILRQFIWFYLASGKLGERKKRIKLNAFVKTPCKRSSLIGVMSIILPINLHKSFQKRRTNIRLPQNRERTKNNYSYLKFGAVESKPMKLLSFHHLKCEDWKWEKKID